MCYLQPLVRSFARYKTRYLGRHAESTSRLGRLAHRPRFRLKQRAAFWAPSGGGDRTTLLHDVIRALSTHRCSVTVDTGWLESDLEVFRGPWTAVQLRTVQEEHGAGNRLVRVAYMLRLSALSKAAAIFAVATTAFLIFFNTWAALIWVVIALVLAAMAWCRWAWLATWTAQIVRQSAEKQGWLTQQAPETNRLAVANEIGGA
jgi:hypothetical protein